MHSRASEGDYVLIPMSTTHRWIPKGDKPLRAYAIEANSHIVPPKRYLSPLRPAARERTVSVNETCTDRSRP